MLTDISKDKLKQLQGKLSATAAVKIIYRAVDVGDFESVNSAVLSTVKELGDIDILVNNVTKTHAQMP